VKPGRALLVILVALAAPVHAQQASVTITADRNQVEVGEPFAIEIEASLSGERNPQVEPPDLADFDVLNRFVSNQFSLAGGRISATTTYHFDLRARSAGRFQIGPARAMSRGQVIESNVVTIVAGGGNAAVDPLQQPDQPTPSNQPDATSQGGADGLPFDHEGFVRAVADIAEPFVGQQVTVTIYLYLRRDLSVPPQITQEPTTNGFWTQSLLPPTRTLDRFPQNVQGIGFQVYVLRRFAAFPLRAGELTIGATAVSLQAGGFFGFGGMPLERTGLPLTIHVRELPSAGRPQGAVHVGTLSMSAELDRNQAATGDAVTLRLHAEGRGQLDQLRFADPSIRGLRVLTPQVGGDSQSPNDVVTGTRTYEWLIVPEREGSYTIPPFEVAVFDPRAATYQVVRTAPLTLVAAGNPIDEPEPTTATPQPAPSSADEPALTFGPIRPRAALSRSRSELVDQAWLPWAMGAPPLLLAFALGFLFVRRNAGRVDPKNAPKLARRSAHKRLREAERLLSAGDATKFYSAVAQAIKEIVEAKLGRAVGSLTHAELRAVLEGRGLSAEPAQRVVDELEGCDFARFSAAGVANTEMQACLGRAQTILSELDRFTPAREDA
jgi:hypothetical protein